MASGSSSISYPKMKEMKKLTRFVTDEEVSGFECVVPPDENLDETGFPTCEFEMPSHFKMKSEWGEWVLPLLTVLETEDDLNSFVGTRWEDFCTLPSEKRSEFRAKMHSIVRRERREMLYKKYMFVTSKGKEHEKKAKAGQEDGKGNQKPKKSLKYREVKKAIRSVSDDDIMLLDFECNRPMGDQLDREGFPDVPDFSMPSDNDLKDEWSKWEPVLRELLGDSFDEDNISWANYMLFPKDNRANHRANMYAHMKRRNRENLYKKWMYLKVGKGKNKVADVQIPKVVAHDISEVATVGADTSEEDVVKHEEEAPKEEVVAHDDRSEVATVGADTSEEDVVKHEEEAPKEEVVAHDKSEVVTVGADGTSEEEVKHDEEASSGDNIAGYVPTGGYNPHEHGTQDINFPIFSDGDIILFYPNPFSLTSWVAEHDKEDSDPVWQHLYTDLGGKVLTREASAIIQALIVCLLDELDAHSTNDSLGDSDNYILTQFIDNLSGSTRVRFKAELSKEKNDFEISTKSAINQFIELLRRICGDCKLIEELRSLLSKYPFSTDNWKRQLLKNYPGLWDEYEKMSFFINLYYRFVSDLKMRSPLNDVFSEACQHRLCNSIFGWQAKIPRDSVYYWILCERVTEDRRRVGGGGIEGDEGVEGEKDAGGNKIAYNDGSLLHIVKYISVVLHHFREKPECKDVDTRLIWFDLSQFFDDILLGIYEAMCVLKIFC